MPASITYNSTTYNFITLEGEVQTLQQEIEDISRPGTIGTAIKEMGQRGERFEMIGIVDCDDVTAAQTLKLALLGLQGKIVGPVVDDHGVTTLKLIVWDAKVPKMNKIVKASGGISTLKGYLVVARFIMQKPTPAGS